MWKILPSVVRDNNNNNNSNTYLIYIVIDDVHTADLINSRTIAKKNKPLAHNNNVEKYISVTGTSLCTLDLSIKPCGNEDKNILFPIYFKHNFSVRPKIIDIIWLATKREAIEFYSKPRMDGLKKYRKKIVQKHLRFRNCSTVSWQLLAYTSIWCVYAGNCVVHTHAQLSYIYRWPDFVDIFIRQNAANLMVQDETNNQQIRLTMSSYIGMTATCLARSQLIWLACTINEMKMRKNSSHRSTIREVRQ